MHSPFQITPQHLNRIKIRALTWPFQNSPFLSFEPFLGGFTGMFWVIVMLHNLHPLQLQFSDRWSYIFLKYPLIQWRIHSGFYDSELARPCCSKAAPNHDISTPMLQMLSLVCATHVFCYWAQTIQLWIHLFKAHCSRSPGLCLGVLWQTLVLPWCFFWQQGFPCTPCMQTKLVQSLSYGRPETIYMRHATSSILNTTI